MGEYSLNGPPHGGFFCFLPKDFASNLCFPKVDKFLDWGLFNTHGTVQMNLERFSAKIHFEMGPAGRIYDRDCQDFELSAGEIDFLWWFIQGSIMFPATRKRLRNAWGMCERHAWGWLAIEASFRDGFMHGPALLYEDIMNRACGAFDLYGPFQKLRVRQNLKSKIPCLMCEEGFGPFSGGYIKEERLVRGRDLSHLSKILEMTYPHWSRTVCGVCAQNSSPVRCRAHLIDDLANDRVHDLYAHRSWLEGIHDHLNAYAMSFHFDFRGSAKIEDISALISAVGWLSGWELFLSHIVFLKGE